MFTMLENQTQIIEFILLGFGEFYEWQMVLFLTFLLAYIVTITGNILIVVLIVFDQHLHTPMYFFLGNLSFLEACYSSDIFPRMLSALLTNNRRISFRICLAQWYLFSSLEAAECCLLCVMSYDRYLAICKPLHYAVIMKTSTCIQLAAVSWINGFVTVNILLAFMLQMTFCGRNEMDHYFCEYFPLIKQSCSDTTLLEISGFIMAFILTTPPFFLTLTSYAYIIAAILKIPSTTGRQKAFSTCSSHLIVVSVFYGSLMIVYMIPRTEVKRNVQKFSSLLYTVLPPLVNPFVYSLRNKEVKEAVKNKIGRFIFLTKCIR
ncbi:olfactory receptor 6C3-like [Varanus komodoensis]|uniref:olfactory receptor 6C3-like n=1 Tax=Varanus komodoensis TaxID=61221 RepID=UPI001CF78E06|nr:olfactory receptor 6C3-like [Varanus komodoensis]